MSVEYRHPEHRGVVACFVEDEDYYVTLPPWGGWQLWGPGGFDYSNMWKNWEFGYA